MSSLLNKGTQCIGLKKLEVVAVGQSAFLNLKYHASAGEFIRSSFETFDARRFLRKYLN
jgi:hypothetical protein